MDIPLDRDAADPASRTCPPVRRAVPSSSACEADLDLGAEGCIVRQVEGRALDVATSFTARHLFRFSRSPRCVGGCRTRATGDAGWYTGDRSRHPPYTEVRRTRHLADRAAAGHRRFPADPDAGRPAAGGAHCPSDRVLRWRLAKSRTQRPSPTCSWSRSSAATGSCVLDPDRAGLADQSSTIPDSRPRSKGSATSRSGVVLWAVRAIRIDDFNYNEFKYEHVVAAGLDPHVDRHLRHAALKPFSGRAAPSMAAVAVDDRSVRAHARGCCAPRVALLVLGGPSCDAARGEIVLPPLHQRKRDAGSGPLRLSRRRSTTWPAETTCISRAGQVGEFLERSKCDMHHERPDVRRRSRGCVTCCAGQLALQAVSRSATSGCDEQRRAEVRRTGRQLGRHRDLRPAGGDACFDGHVPETCARWPSSAAATSGASSSRPISTTLRSTT